tara:strand:+ start:64 stop:933 length:870 start_codon:yes stop_codon:yes gene_type:complete
MATEQLFNGTTSTATEYAITAFSFLNTSDVKVSISGGSNLSSSAYNVTSAGILTLNPAPGAGTGNVRAFRNTDVVTAAVNFTTGSSIRSTDLNRATRQVRFAVEELQTIGADGAGIPLTAGDKGGITVNTGTSWSIDDGAVTTAKIPDNAITTAKIPDNAITTAKIPDNAITTAKIPDNGITTAKINADAVTMDKLGAGSLPSDIDVGAAQLTGTINSARLPSVLPAIDGSNLTGVSLTVGSGCVYENNQTISTNYTVGSNKNAMSAGPITIANGIVVTIGSTESYTIV